MGRLMTKLGPPVYSQWKCHALNAIVMKATGMNTCILTNIELRKVPLDSHIQAGLTGEKNSPQHQKNKSVNTENKAESSSDKMLQTAKPQEKGQENLQIVDTVSISKEVFQAID